MFHKRKNNNTKELLTWEEMHIKPDNKLNLNHQWDTAFCCCFACFIGKHKANYNTQLWRRSLETDAWLWVEVGAGTPAFPMAIGNIPKALIMLLSFTRYSGDSGNGHIVRGEGELEMSNMRNSWKTEMCRIFPYTSKHLMIWKMSIMNV